MDYSDKIFNDMKNSIINNQETFKKYAMLEAIYKDIHQQQGDNLFPNNWYQNYDYEERAKVLENAIRLNKTIEYILNVEELD